MDRLLALANGAALHKALSRLGAGVSYRTVARWVGDEPDLKPPAEMVPAILTAFGADEKEAPPEWARRVVAVLQLIAEREGFSDEDLLHALNRALLPLVAGRQARPPQSDDGTPASRSTGTRDS